MSFNGSGTFNINTAGQPVVSGTVISSTAFNALTADLATGLSTCITKDGQTTVSANIPMNNFKFTGLAAGTAATDSARVGQLQAGGATVVTVSGTDTYTGTMSPSLTAYAAGNTFTFVVPNTNTTSCTLNIDGLGAKAITRDGSTALVAGDLVSGSEVIVAYDGTRFQVLNSNSKTNWNLSGTLTVAGNTTLSGGTANGVAYLNGSKVVTTGSALTFDGTTLTASTSAASSGIFKATSTTAQVANLQAQNDAGTALYMGVFGSAAGSSGTLSSSSPFVSTNGTQLVLNVNNNSGTFVWGIGSTPAEQMRLNSTGLGIGTSSPSYKLDVSGNGRFSGSAATAIINANNGTAATLQLTQAGVGNWLKYFRVSDNSFVEQFGGTDLLTLTTGGNLGLGVTPSAWGASFKAFEFSGGNSLYSNGGQSSLGSNAYNDGAGWKYKATSPAGLYTNAQGTHVWYNAPSGTAGNAISFTQAMTLDSGGFLGLGVTPSAWGVPAGKAIEIGTVGNCIWGVGASNMFIGSNTYYGSSSFRYANTGSLASGYQQAGGVHTWYNAASGTAGNIISFTTAMTLNTNGNLVLQGGTAAASGVGVTFPAAQSASTDANCLDDYEEGTWSPTFTNCGTASASFAKYTKVGRIVNIEMAMSATSLTANSSRFTLPLSCDNIVSGVYTRSTLEGGFVECQGGTALCYFASTPSSTTGTFYVTATYLQQ